MVTQKEFDKLDGRLYETPICKAKFAYEHGTDDWIEQPGVQVFYASVNDLKVHDEDVTRDLVELMVPNFQCMNHNGAQYRLSFGNQPVRRCLDVFEEEWMVCFCLGRRLSAGPPTTISML